MQDDHEEHARFRLPEAFVQSGDPVDGNPFPADSAAHRVWTEATRRADEEICRINSTLSVTTDNANVWMQSLVEAKFDVWARRGVQVVWFDAAVVHYDRWLLDYANSWIELMSEHLAGGLPTHLADGVLLDLRNRLGSRVQFWRAEARAYRRRQEAAEKPRDTATTAKRRQAVILPVLKRLGISKAGWASRAGFDPAVVYDYLDGKSNPRADNRNTLAQAIELPELPE